jgi:hypothetical protein
MSRGLGRKGAVLLALAPLLGGCFSLDRREWTVADSGSGGMFRAAWGGMRSDRLEGSDTIQRIRGVEAPREPLELEPGNVWPRRKRRGRPWPTPTPRCAAFRPTTP